MGKDVQQERQWAVQRFFGGESPDAICVSLGRSRTWLYKWADRFLEDSPEWFKSKSRRPLSNPLHTAAVLHPLKKPTAGRYHLIRFIRSDCRLNIFGELFPVPSELQYKYVVATIDVKEQKLKLFLENTKVDEINYHL